VVKKLYVKENTNKYTADQLAKIVANDFKETMKEFDFESFEEMARTYWWTSKDIKKEIDAILREYTNNDAYIDEVDETLVIFNNGTDDIPYRTFSNMWKRYLKQ
jgi:predicted alpha-1,6-mannanase (GH76 family)